MTIIQKLQATFLDWRSALFGKPKSFAKPNAWGDNAADFDSALADRLGLVRVDMSGLMNVADDPAFRGDPRQYQNVRPAALRAQRLAEIATERARLHANKATILKAKKPFYRLLRDLTNEEIQIETGRMVYDPAFGAWVVKGADQ